MPQSVSVLDLVLFWSLAPVLLFTASLSCERARIEVKETPVRVHLDINPEYLQYFPLQMQEKKGWERIKDEFGNVFYHPKESSISLIDIDVLGAEYYPVSDETFNLMLPLTSEGHNKVRQFFRDNGGELVGVVINGKLELVGKAPPAAANPLFLGEFTSEAKARTIRDDIRRGGKTAQKME